jgi:hypothetical protein
MAFVNSDIVNQDHATGKSNVPPVGGWRNRATGNPNIALRLKSAGTPVMDVPNIQNPAMFDYPRRAGAAGATQARLDLRGLQRTLLMNTVGSTKPDNSILGRIKAAASSSRGKVSTVKASQLPIHQQPGMFHQDQQAVVAGKGKKKTGLHGLGDERTNRVISAVQSHINNLKAEQGGYLTPQQSALAAKLQSRIVRVVSGMSGLGDDSDDDLFTGGDTGLIPAPVESSLIDILPPSLSPGGLIAPVSLLPPSLSSSTLIAPNTATAQTDAQIAQLNAYNQALTDVNYNPITGGTSATPTASTAVQTAQVTSAVATLAKALAGGGTPTAAQLAQAQAAYAAQQNPLAALTSSSGIVYIGLALVGVLVISMVAGRRK